MWKRFLVNLKELAALSVLMLLFECFSSMTFWIRFFHHQQLWHSSLPSYWTTHTMYKSQRKTGACHGGQGFARSRVIVAMRSSTPSLSTSTSFSLLPELPLRPIDCWVQSTFPFRCTTLLCSPPYKAWIALISCIAPSKYIP